MTEIISNGSKWAGESPDTIEDLIEVLKSETLDPIFEEYGNFVNRTPHWIHKEAQEKYKGCTQIFGNFFATSHVFNITTDDEDLISTIENIVRLNQNTTNIKK